MADISKEEQMIAAKALAAQKAAAIASQKQADKLAKTITDLTKDLRKSNKDLLKSVGKDWAAVADKQGKTGAERDKIIKEGQEQFLHKQATVLHEHRKKEAEARQKARDDARVEQLKNEKMAKSGLPEELAKDLAKKEVAAEKREEARKESQGGIFQMLRNIHNSGKQGLEERFEENKAKRQGAAELKKQGGFLAGIFGNTEKKEGEKKGGVLGFLADHWGKILLGLGVALTLLLAPLKDLGKAWEKMFGGDSWTEIGTKIGLSVLGVLGAKIAAGALFTGLAKMIMTSLLPAGTSAAAAAAPAAGSLGALLLPLAAIVGFVAGAVGSIWSGIEGADLSKEWGVDKVDGAIGGFIGGTGKGLSGALGNALKKGGMGAGIGFAVGGPVGMLVGGIIGASFGAITGYIGGEKIAQWVNSSKKSIAKAWDNTMLAIDSLATTVLKMILPESEANKIRNKAERELDKRKSDVGGDIVEMSQEDQNILQKKKLKELEEKEIGGKGASLAVKKKDLAAIEAEMTAKENAMDALSNKGDIASNLKRKELATAHHKLRLEKIKIMDEEAEQIKAEKALIKETAKRTLPSGPTDLKEKSVIYANQRIQDNVRKSAAINPKLAKMVNISGGAFKHAGEQMRITSGFRNKASQAKAMEGLRLRDPKQYEKNYGMDAKNDSSTDEWLKKNASRHQSGNAIDISYPKGVDRKTILKSLNKRLRGVGYAMGEGDHIHINTGLKGIKPAMEEITAFEDKFENFKPASAPDDRTGAMNEMQTQNLEGNRQAAAPMIISPTQVSTVNNSNSGSTNVLTGSGAGNSARIDQR